MSASLTRIGAVVDRIEETSIALCLGLMTLITFSNVIARYLFNTNILWALESTVFLFAWLVLMGASYGVKKHIHIGVDVVINQLPPLARRITSGIALLACLTFSIMLLIGSYHYWLPFATDRAWLETEDIPMPEALQFLSGWLNEGERYENLPRMIPYLALPLGMLLLTYRFAQVGWKLLRGEVDRVISSHEGEAMQENNQNATHEGESRDPWKS